MLQLKKPLNILNNIHNEFAVTQIDIANGNVAFIFQRFYAFVLIKELDLIRIQLPDMKLTFK